MSGRPSSLRSDGLLASICLVALLGFASAARAQAEHQLETDWTTRFQREVDHRIDVPAAARDAYVRQLQQALTQAGTVGLTDEAFVLVDRSPQVQAAFVVVRRPDGGWWWMGSTAVSTGKVGTYEHFVSPLGVFAHELANPDFRAEGTLNKNHIRGYGAKGRRVFDFGWQVAERGWGTGGTSRMRLQMHATDPNVLEQRLGRIGSEGCIRIAATLNVFLDRHGVLDLDDQQAVADGEVLWVLGRDREVVPWPGRYLVIVDSGTVDRPSWSPPPGTPQTAATPVAPAG